MMNSRKLFDENVYDIREQAYSPIVLAKKKIILSKTDKKDITAVSSNRGIIVTDSMEMIEDLFVEQSKFIKTR